MKSPALWFAGAVVIGASVSCLAQSFPSRPIRVIVAMPPGAGQDIMLRKIGEEIAPRIGQPFVIDNRPGGAQIPAMEACRSAPADGHNLCLLTATTQSINPHVFNKLPYEPERDYKPIANLYTQIEALMVAAKVPAGSAKELQSLAVARSGQLNFGTLGEATASDLFRQMLSEEWGTRIAGIPYKGGNLIITALVASEVDMAWIGAYNAIGQQKAGKVRFLALGSSKRLRLLPEVPTLDELNLKERPRPPWVAIGAPAATPDAVIARLNTELGRVFADTKFVDYIETQYIESLFGTPQELTAYMRRDREAYGLLVKKYNLPKQ